MLWKETYALGVPLIDGQHKELFSRVEAFFQVLRSKDTCEEKIPKLNETLEFMKGYVVEHFRDEEEYQKRINYPGYEAHEQIHSSMVQYVLEVSKEFEEAADNSEKLMQQFEVNCLHGLLTMWLPRISELPIMPKGRREGKW